MLVYLIPLATAEIVCTLEWRMGMSSFAFTLFHIASFNAQQTWQMASAPILLPTLPLISCPSV